MSRLLLLGGAYSARSPIANAQRCINLFPEGNPKDAPVPVTYYQTPGKRLVAGNPGSGPARCLYRASNGQGYYVAGASVYYITPGNGLTLLGIIGTATGICSMIDNGITVLLVDASSQGYTITLATNAFALFVDPTGTFQGASRVDYLDTFIMWNVLGTNEFGSTLSNELAIDPTYIAAKTGYPDPLQTLIVNRHEILLIGQLKTEIWFDAGGSLFPFAELPGAYFEHGTCARYSVASTDISVFWLSQDLQGQGMVFRAQGYDCKKISNFALDFQIRKMAAQGIIADAVGFCYQQDGHVFYQLNFPTGDQSWVWDEASNEWHQRCWSDANGVLHRDRAQVCANINGQILVGDWQTGDLLALDLTVYTDYVSGALWPISRLRSWPHISAGTMNLGLPGLDRPVDWNGRVIQVKQFVLDLECGGGELDAEGNPPEVFLRWSNKRGRVGTFGQAVMQSAGEPGQYEYQPQFRNQGQARDIVLEVEYNFAGEAALNGAWIDATVSQV